ncbi:MAG TPA: AAA family ATPase [Actinomycetota bacterium]|nr:AAA family ATPase [Actinomycetota bacterium]
MSELREGTTTVLFTDVEGSTDLGTRAGDDSARRVLRRQEEIIRTQVQSHAGHEVKALGDGLMVAFSSARKAVSCAASMQRELERAADASTSELPAVRIGLNAGEVIVEDGDLFGAAVSAAARICGAASGGEVLVAEVVKVLAGTVPGVTWKDRGEVALKGFPEPCRLYRAEWREDPVADTSGLTPFVGRKKERAELRAWFDRLEDGRGGLVVIGGEPGVGKTRLAEELIRDADAHGFRTVTGRCYEMESPSPYGPFVEVLEAASKEVDPVTFRMALGPSAGEIAKVLPQLRHGYDDIPPPLELPPEQERRYLFNSIRDFIRRASALKPLVVLFDDVHWADDASLQLMEHIAPELPDMPVLVIATYRDVELDVYRPLAKTLEDLLRRRLVTRMSLTRLPEETVGAMLSKLAGETPPPSLTTAIYRETEGNAFFVEEVFRHLDEEGRLRDDDGRWRADLRVEDLEVPEGVRLVIGRRLQRLAPETTKILTAAAVIGRVFDFRLLEAVAGDGERDGDELLDCLDEAQRSHVVMSRAEGRDAKVVFVHELIRQTLLGAIALPRRQRLHLRVAEAMEKVYADELASHAAEIAHHLYNAGVAADPAKTQEYLVMAGDRAMDGAAFGEALKYFEEACELRASQSDSERAAILYRVGLARRSLGHLDEGLSAWREALALYEAAGDVASVAAVTPEIGLQLGWAARWPEALEIAGRGLAAIGEGMTGDRARLHGIAAIGLGWAGDYDGAMQMIDAAESISRQLDDPLLIGSSLTVKTAHHFAYNQTRAGIETGEQAMALLRGTAEEWNYGACVAFTAFAHYFCGELDRAGELAEEAIDVGRRLGHLAAQMFGERAGFFVKACRGEATPADFVAFSERDYELCRRSGLPFEAYSTSFAAEAEWRRGNLDEAVRLADEAAATEPPSALWGFAQGLRFMIYAAAGRADEARAILAELEGLLPQPGRPNPNGLWSVLLFLIEGRAVLGLRRDDAKLYELAGELREAGPVMRFDAQSLELLRALAAAGAGLDDAAPGHFERAIEEAEELGLVHARSDSSLYYAEFLAGRGGDGDSARARDLLDAAVAGFERIGWAWSKARAEALRERL